VPTREALSVAYLESHPDRAAAQLERFSVGEVAAFLGGAPPAIAADVIARLAPFLACACVLEMPADVATAVLEAVPLDIASGLFRRMSAPVREQLITSLSESRSQTIRGLLRFAERTAGALLDPLVLALPRDTSAAAALERVKTADPDHVDGELFVIDRDHTLLGVVTIHALVAARGEANLETLMRPVAYRLAATSLVESVLANPEWAHTRTAPVVDDRNVFLGALHYDTALRYADSGSSVPPSATVIQTLINLSELYWLGCGRLTTELVTALTDHQSARHGPRA